MPAHRCVSWWSCCCGSSGQSALCPALCSEGSLSPPLLGFAALLLLQKHREPWELWKPQPVWGVSLEYFLGFLEGFLPSAALSRHLTKLCFRTQSQADLFFGTQSLKITRRALQTWISAICLFHLSFVVLKTALIQFLLQEVQHFSNLNIELTGTTNPVK